MPTSRGWAALGTATAMIVLWIGFGERELLAAAAFLGMATLAGVAFVRTVAPRMSVERRLSPAQVHEGDRVIVEVTISARRAVRNLAVEDEVERLGAARFVASDIDAGRPLTARYEVLCRPRGIYKVGPARGLVNDPLGLAEARATVGTTDRLVVYPAVEDLEGFPSVRGQDPTVQSTSPTFTQHGGEDFFALREYQHGDDLRRVHWPSSARRDELMIRQLEIPWQSRALVILDHRREVYESGEAFEHAVRGAASLVQHFYRGGYSPELWTLDAVRPPVTGGPYRSAMERLASVEPVGNANLHRSVTRLQKQRLVGGAMVMVTGLADEQNVAAFRTLARDFSRRVILGVNSAGSEALAAMERSGMAVVVVRPGDAWAPGWRDAMERAWSTV